VSSTALIIGGSGQTGAYLAHRLLQQGQSVTVTSRDAATTSWWRFDTLGISQSVETMTLDPASAASISGALERYQPDSIYYLAGPSSVAQSFESPAEVFRDITQPIITILDVLANAGYSGSFFNATSTDCFGNNPDQPLDESSAMRPVSPYGVAKAATFSLTKNYRETFGLKASNGILTNHESPLREPHFVTQKIVSTLKKIKAGEETALRLGNTAIRRDWLWAGEVADAISLIGASAHADDYLVASGTNRSLDEFVELTCVALGIDKTRSIVADTSLHRPMDIASLSFNPTKIRQSLSWSAQMRLEDIVANLVAGNATAGLSMTVAPPRRRAPQ
jgi:GDPmannose 4,6-dehydratase